MAKKKRRNGTPPAHEYPYAIRTANALWGEPGILIVTSAEPLDQYISEWRHDQPVLKVKKLVKQGDTFHRFLGDPGEASKWEVVKEWDLPRELLAGPTSAQCDWVAHQLIRYARDEHKVEIFK